MLIDTKHIKVACQSTTSFTQYIRFLGVCMTVLFMQGVLQLLKLYNSEGTSGRCLVYLMLRLCQIFKICWAPTLAH